MLKADIELDIKDKIGQDKVAAKAIFKSIRENSKILIHAPMSAGKTYFTVHDIGEQARQENKKVIIVIPGVAQIDSMENEYNIATVCKGKDYHEEDNIVAVTPDSVLKITDKLKSDSYYLIVDEGHEKVTSSTYRAEAFRKIIPAELKAYKTIYMTATPQSLDPKDFNQIIKINREIELETKAKILQVDKLDTDTIKMAIGKYKPLANQTVVYNDNKRQNSQLAEYFHKTSTTKEKILKESYQMELEQDNAQYIEKENITLLYGADTVKSGDETEIMESIHNRIIPESVNLLFTTSVIKAGLNIDNNEDMIAIIVCNRGTFDFLSQVQFMGRFRNGLKKVVFILEKKSEDNKTYYESLEDTRKNMRKVAKTNFALLTEKTGHAPYHTKELISLACAIKDEAGGYMYDEVGANAKFFTTWARSLLLFPNILKYHLRTNGAIKLTSIDIEDFTPTSKDTDLEDIIKEQKEAEKEEIEKAMLVIKDDLDNETKLDVLTYQLHQGKADPAIVEAMNLYHSKGNKKKVEQVAEILCNGNIIEAFDMVHTRNISTINRNIKKQEIKLINQSINKVGAKAYLQDTAKETLDVRTAKIRYELRDLEKSQGRISQARLNKLNNELIKKGYTKTKVLQDSSSSKNDIKKATHRAVRRLEKELKLIYNFKGTSKNIISSVKTN